MPIAIGCKQVLESFHVVDNCWTAKCHCIISYIWPRHIIATFEHRILWYIAKANARLADQQLGARRDAIEPMSEIVSEILVRMILVYFIL